MTVREKKALEDYLEQLNIFRSMGMNGIHLGVLKELAEMRRRLI